ncbi:MAG: SDR family oxidoreductase [Ferrimicrobium sp.]
MEIGRREFPVIHGTSDLGATCVIVLLERGVAVNARSASGSRGPGRPGRSTSRQRGGVGNTMVLHLASESARYGIRANAISPVLFETPMVGLLSEESRWSLVAQVPFPDRLGLPQEYGALAVYIVENTMLNGEVISLDEALCMTAR